MVSDLVQVAAELVNRSAADAKIWLCFIMSKKHAEFVLGFKAGQLGTEFQWNQLTMTEMTTSWTILDISDKAIFVWYLSINIVFSNVDIYILCILILFFI